jgi:hypothetical protein
VAVNGNFTVDTDTLFVDAANNRVGMGTSSPAEKLHVVGTIIGQANDNYFGNYSSGAYIDIGNLATSEMWLDARSSTLTDVPLNLRTKGAGEIKFTVGASERLRIDSAGRVTMPYQPALMIDSMQSNTNGSNFSNGSIHVNRGGMSYNSSTGVVTVPVAGVYRIHWHMLSNASSSSGQCVLYINGAFTDEVFYNTGTASSLQTVGATHLRSLGAGDTVSIQNVSGSWYSQATGNVLFVELVG